MRTLGLDLSVDDKKTWLATVDWASGQAQLVTIEQGLPNRKIADRATQQGVDVIGIDCPFGWPTKFVDLVTAHRDFDVDHEIGNAERWRDQHAWRRTDAAVKGREDLSVQPLSVSADKIGHTAMRCATLLAEMSARGVDIERDGKSGLAVEVYPAASLDAWGLPSKGYKEPKNRTARKELVDLLLQRIPFLEVSAKCRIEMEKHDDALDAVVAALSARAARTDGWAVGPEDAADLAAAAIEGWIWVPLAGTLERLAG